MDVILTYQAAPGDLIKAVVDLGAKGVVIAGAGAGATSGTQGEGISYATEKGAFVVTTTRTGQGFGIGGTGGRAGSRRIGGDDLQPVKARILLMLALATTSDPAEVQRMFREYLSYNSKFVRSPSGPVAQLGARMNGIHEVTGSIPVWSTISKSLIPHD